MAATLCSVLAAILLCIAYAHADILNDVETDGAPVNTTDIDRSSFYQSPGGGNIWPSSEKKYVLRNINVNWFRALQMCFAEGKRLATIMSAEENNKLKNYLKNMGGPLPQDMWIGATDLAEEGRFMWMPTGEPVSYTNWDTASYGRQPDSNKGIQHCAHTMYFKPADIEKLEWNDADCMLEKPFVCEYKENMPQPCLQYKW